MNDNDLKHKTSPDRVIKTVVMSKKKNKNTQIAASKLLFGGALLILAICISRVAETEKKELQETKKQPNNYQLVFNGFFTLAILISLIVLISKM